MKPIHKLDIIASKIAQAMYSAPFIGPFCITYGKQKWLIVSTEEDLFEKQDFLKYQFKFN